VAGFQTLAGLAASPYFGEGELEAALAPLAGNQIPMLARAQGLSAGPNGGPRGLIQLHVPAQLFRDVALAVATRKR
jgi:hypothetical protein